MPTATGMAAPSRSIVEAAALAEPTATFTPALAQAEREKEAILGLNPAISESRSLATLRDPPATGLGKLPSAELSVDAASATMEASV